MPSWKDFHELTLDEFEQSWRVCAYGSFLCAREAAGDMLSAGSGAILFTGATSSIRGRAGALAFSSAKFAVRGLAWALARELWPEGIHVAHVIIDGVLDTPLVREGGYVEEGEPLLNIDAVAAAYWSLVQQDKGAWGFEIDLRPHDEGSSSKVNYPGVRAVAIIQPHHQSCHRGLVLSRDPVESRNEPTLPINQPHHQSRHRGMVLSRDPVVLVVIAAQY